MPSAGNSETDLKDVWRELKGDERRFSFHSQVHNTYSRIDYIFVSNDLLPRVNDTVIDVIQISDHARVKMELMFNCDYKVVNRWRMDTSIFRNPNLIEKFQKDLYETWEINEKGGGQH